MRCLGPILTVALLATACRGSDVVLEPAPSFEAALATLYVVERDDAPARLFAADRDVERPFSLAVDDVAKARVTALGYDRGLDALGLEAGEVELVTVTRCRARPLPGAAAVHTLTVVDGAPEGWVPATELPAELRALRIDGPCPCRAFDRVATVDVPTPAVSYIGEPDHQRLLLLLADGGLSSVDPAGVVAVVETATKAPVLELSAITRAPDGTTWLANESGEVLRGRLGEAFEVIATVSGGGDYLRHLMVGPAPGVNEVYGVTEIGFVVSLEPGPPAILARPEGLAEVSNQRARILWLGPGQIVATPPTRRELIFVTNGREVGRSELPAGSGGARFLADVPGLGAVVLTHDARVYELEGQAPRLRADAPELGTPAGLLTFDGGLFYVGDGGYLQELRADYGFCPTQYLEGTARAVGLVRLGERLAVIGDRPADGVQVTMYESRPLEP